MELWPHQQRALVEIPKAMETNKRVLVVAPTGAGKSRVMFDLIKALGFAVIYTDRRALLDQLAQNMDTEGIVYGYRAAGLPRNDRARVQLCMVQTENSRVVVNEERGHVITPFVFIDEAHRLKGGMMQALIDLHLADSATIVGFSATPTNLEGQYDTMVTLATNAECRACGAHVPAICYCPFEVDTKHLNPQSGGEYSPTELEKTFARPEVFGPVLYHWKIIGGGRPTILFGPDVAGAIWFQEQFNSNGIPAGHIDGEQIIIKGEHYEPTTENRRYLFDCLKNGDIKVLTTRFVLREGIDLPFVSCLILATKFGTITTYLQSVGRGMRSAPGKECVKILDHGGNYDLHGSPNDDRHWSLGDTDREILAKRKAQLREKNMEDSIPEPVVCPKCNAIRKYGKQCPACGHESHKRSRYVMQRDGNLRLVHGDMFKPRRQSNNKSEEGEWVSMYHRAKRAGMTFNQAEALFAKERNWNFPHRSWRLMPRFAAEFALKVRDVPYDRLTTKE